MNLKALAALHAAGKPQPIFDRLPTIDPIYAWLWEAWGILHRTRACVGGQPQPIPVSEILAYAVYQDITDETRRGDLLHVIVALDGVFFGHLAAKQGSQPR